MLRVLIRVPAPFIMSLFIGSLFFVSLSGPVLADIILGGSSPEQAVRLLADAIREKDLSTFHDIVDIDALLDAPAAAEDNGLEDAILPPFRQRRMNAFIEGIASGTYALACSEAERPGCPWYPEGLIRAIITQTDAHSAIAAVESSRQIRTWLVLHETEQGWRVTAATDSIREAQRYATDNFRRLLAEYQEDLRDLLRQEQDEHSENPAQYVRAKKRAVSILNEVPLSNPSFSIRKGPRAELLNVTCTATNNTDRPVRLMRTQVEVVDQNGKRIHHYDFIHPTDMISPGESKTIVMTRPLGPDPDQKTIADELLKGACKAHLRPTSVLLGVHVDEDGGDFLDEE